MQRPRRTTDYETPSTAPQSRPSRLHQPLRRPSFREGSLSRSSSAEPLNSLGVPSSSKRQRSNSVSNIRTPQRTPTHITPSKVSQFTAEKQRAPVNDKRWIQEQVVRITEYLKSVDCGVNVDFLHRGGLKTMSIKQFIGLVNYFLKFVTGNKFTVGTNHVESISKILNQIDYPYTMNKSWLKTPTAPHAFNNVVMLFSFFMDFIPPADNLESFKKNYLIISEEYPDTEFAFKLFAMAEEGFTLWNYQKNEDFEKLQTAALDELIFKKTTIPGSHALDEEIKRVNAQLDKIVSKTAKIKDEDEYFRLDKEAKTNQRQIAKLQKARQEHQKAYNKLQAQLNVQMEHVAKMEARIVDIRNVVDNQEVSIDKRNKLIEEVGQMEFILKTKRQAVCDLQEMDNQQQILLSRQLKQLTEKIAKFNSYIRQTMLDFQEFDVDIETLCLHQNSKVELQDQLDGTVLFLKKLKRHVSSRLNELSEGIEAFQTQINLITYEIDGFVEPKAKEMLENVREQQSKVDDIEREIIGVRNETSNAIRELRKKIRKTSASIESLKKLAEKKRKEITAAKQENKEMMEFVEERFENFFMVRERELDRFQQALFVLHNKCADARSIMEFED